MRGRFRFPGSDRAISGGAGGTAGETEGDGFTTSADTAGDAVTGESARSISSLAVVLADGRRIVKVILLVSVIVEAVVFKLVERCQRDDNISQYR